MTNYHLHIDPSTDAVGVSPASDYNVNPSNCIIQLSDPIRPREITPVQFTASYSWYPIEANNVLTLVDTIGATKSCAVAVADYSNAASGLATAVNDAITASGAAGTITCTYSSTTNAYTIAASGNITLRFDLNIHLASMLGFNPSTLSGAASYASTAIPNLTGPNYLMLLSDELAASKTVFGGRKRPVILKIPVDVSWGSVINYNVDYDAEISKRGDEINKLDFKLVYPDNTLVNLNGQTWSLSLKITE